MIVATYLAKEGFEDKRGSWYSRELNTTISTTPYPNVYTVTIEDHTFRDIVATDLPKVIDAVNNLSDTELVVELYNLQQKVLTKYIKPLVEGL